MTLQALVEVILAAGAAFLLFRDVRRALRDPLRRGEPIEPLIVHTLAVKPERHHLVQGRSSGSGGLLALSQVGG